MCGVSGDNRRSTARGPGVSQCRRLNSFPGAKRGHAKRPAYRRGKNRWRHDTRTQDVPGAPRSWGKAGHLPKDVQLQNSPTDVSAPHGAPHSRARGGSTVDEEEEDTRQQRRAGPPTGCTRCGDGWQQTPDSAASPPGGGHPCKNQGHASTVPGTRAAPCIRRPPLAQVVTSGSAIEPHAGSPAPSARRSPCLCSLLLSLPVK